MSELERVTRRLREEGRLPEDPADQEALLDRIMDTPEVQAAIEEAVSRALKGGDDG